MDMTKLLLVVFGIHLTLIICGIAEIPGTALYQFLIDPIIWDSSGFLSSLISDVTALIGAGLIVAGTIITRSDIFLFAGITTLFISFGLPLAELFMLVSEQAHPILATLLVSPVILIYLITCIAFWRGRA